MKSAFALQNVALLGTPEGFSERLRLFRCFELSWWCAATVIFFIFFHFRVIAGVGKASALTGRGGDAGSVMLA